MRRSLKQGTSGVQSHREKKSFRHLEKKRKLLRREKNNIQTCQQQHFMPKKMMELTHLIQGGKISQDFYMQQNLLLNTRG